MRENYIEVKNLTKFYGKKKALDGINIDIPKGKIIGLLGKNGAGKSTFLRCLLGFLKHSGEINIMGETISSHKHSIHNHIAFIPDVNCLDDRMTVEQTMNYVASLNDSWNSEKADKLLLSSDLPLKQKVSSLSKGMKTKLYLLITLSLDVEILLLDEPTLGLDIVFRKEFFNTILGEFYDENKTIIISTHQVEEVEHILDEIVFIDDGKIIVNEDINELKDTYSVFHLTSDRKSELEELKPRVINSTLGNVNAVLKSNTILDNAKISRPSLSDIFLEVVGGHDEKV